MNNQESFLANIRRAVGKSPSMPSGNSFQESAYDTAEWSQQQRPGTRTEEELSTLADLFCENAKSLNLATVRVKNSREAAEVIAAIVASSQPEFQQDKQIILHDHPLLRELELGDRLPGTIPVHIALRGDPAVREKTIASFIGITTPELGIADCAAVVQMTGSGRPRSTSLVPSIHIAVLRRDRLVGDINAAYAWLAARQELPDSFVFISGPSKTADIEGHLVHGAHGPRAMHVILVQ